MSDPHVHTQVFLYVASALKATQPELFACKVKMVTVTQSGAAVPAQSVFGAVMETKVKHAVKSKLRTVSH